MNESADNKGKAIKLTGNSIDPPEGWKRKEFSAQSLPPEKHE